MKLITYVLRSDPATARIPRVGVMSEDLHEVIDLSADFTGMLDLIDQGGAGLSLAQQRLTARNHVIPFDAVTLLSPLPEPRQMRDAMAFEQHFQQSINTVAAMRVGPLAPLARWLGIAKVPRVWYEQPVYYKCNRFSVIGTDADVVWPRGARLMDYECEIAVVIGKRGKDIAKRDALDHVFGYTIYNDMTARDVQLREMEGRLGPAKGKDFDTGNVLGPWIVTPDEIDPYALTMVAKVNGQERGRGFSGDMHHRWEDIVAYVSQNETLYAGEVIGSGTVGNGCGLEQRRFLDPGDLIELEVSGIGTLRNRLVKT